MANSTANKTTLKKGDNLPARGKGKKSLMLDAIRLVCGDESDFLQQVVTIGIGGWTQPEQKEDEEPTEPVFQNPNPMLLNMVLNRIEPPLKSVSPMVEFEFDITAKPYEQATQVLNAMAQGKIPSDIGQLFVTSISSMLNIQEKTDFEERLKAIEDVNEQD
jgi:hypothetical protein